MSATAGCHGELGCWDELAEAQYAATLHPGHSRGWSPSRLCDPGAMAAKEMFPGYADPFKTLFCF